MSLPYYRALMSSVPSPLDLVKELSIDWQFLGDVYEYDGLTLSGSGNVDNFNDLSGKDYHFESSTTTESLKPKIGGSGQILLNGTDGFLKSTATKSVWTFLHSGLNSPCIFARVKLTFGLTEFDTILCTSVFTANVGFFLALGGSSASFVNKIRYRMSYGNVSSTLIDIESTAGLFNDAGFFNLGSTFNTGNYIAAGNGAEPHVFYKNNVSVFSGTNVQTAYPTSSNTSAPTNNLCIGAREDGSFKTQMEITRLAIGKGLPSSNDRTIIHNWLNS